MNPIITALMNQLGIKTEKLKSGGLKGKLVIEDLEIDFVIRRLDRDG
ncbi:hypothetical protein [Archaeoglobus veneficus]|uniref:Uncharacterized protein n=1 Tax=Archaeoglobus veneficus (strain DSM 11195 / SNP6) TaxID=693661 RepID=F2KR39_ARCVS|nr:hypothetical protein [Archaeoglobus veneficus]AEA46676.1 hypothetical protein Arcve_0656 [Archaeoglobus veneficus SNP6]